MGLFGTLVQGALGGFPKKPDVPTAPFVDPALAQRQTTEGNLAALPDLMDLGDQVNAYNLEQRSKALNAGIPGYSDITQTGSNVLLSELNGQLPSSVASAIRRNANTKAFAGGFQDSGAADALEARDLGLGALDLIQRGQSAAPGWLSVLNNLAVPPEFNITSGFLSPAQTISANQWNEGNRFNTQWLQNQLDSLPDPETAAIAKDVGQITDLVATAALAWAGGGLGGMIGGAGGASMGAGLGSQIGGGTSAGGMDLGLLIGNLMGGRQSANTGTLPAYNDFGGEMLF